jgi:UDP-N-acetyl-2-amino-2-deoxyglucuronate dehydrogenase
LKQTVKEEGKTTFRSITVNEEEIEFSGGFTDLHTLVYQDILSGGGFGIEDARSSIDLVYDIRNAELTHPDNGHRHPFLANL